MKKVFASIRSGIEQKLYKFPKKLDIPQNTSVDIACFFVDMEKLFGSESIINELEEDDSEVDENDYNNQFMNELRNQEISYIKKYSKDQVNPVERYSNKFTESYGKKFTNQKDLKSPDLSKIKSTKLSKDKMAARVKYSPYTGSEKAQSKERKQKINPQTISKKIPGVIILKKKGHSSKAVVPVHVSKNPASATTTHTSSIPALPPVVKDSWFKDKVSKQNLEGVMKRVQHRQADIFDIYQDTDDNDNRSSIEVPYFSKEHSHQDTVKNKYGLNRYGSVRSSHEGKSYSIHLFDYHPKYTLTHPLALNRLIKSSVLGRPSL